MRSRQRWPLLLLVMSGLAGCTMADSRAILEGSEVACHDSRGSSLGAYYLPKSYFEVRVYRWRNPDTNDDFFKLQVEGTITRADPSRQFCLDYLASVTSKDSLRAVKTEEDVLQKISSRAEDQSAEIIKKLLQTIFTLIIGFGGGPGSEGRAADGDAFAKVPWVEIFRAEYDPTDTGETAFINDRLKEFGFCLISQDQPEQRATDPNTYCEAPMRYAASPQHHHDEKPRQARAARGEEPHAKRAGRDERAQHGIFYRPRLPYDIFLFSRLDRKQKGKWSFRRKATIEIENHAPIISVGVDRTFFATRTTVLTFDQGVLSDVQVYKTSELQSAIEIPIYILDQAWKLPTNIIRFRIDQFKNENTLKRAEAKLLDAELQRVKARKNPSSLNGDVLKKAADFRKLELVKGELPK